MAHRAVRVEFLAVQAGDAGGFLAAMLERMEAKRDHGGCGFGVADAENAAFFAQLVVIKRMGGEHWWNCPLLAGI